jgi:hypothetical protein
MTRRVGPPITHEDVLKHVPYDSMISLKEVIRTSGYGDSTVYYHFGEMFKKGILVRIPRLNQKTALYVKRSVPKKDMRQQLMNDFIYGAVL